MFLRALLPCEELRVAPDGALALIGVRTGDLVATALPDGKLAVERLVFVTIVSGLRGQEWVEVRHALAGGGTRTESALHAEPHDPASDDHVFLFGDAPMVFPAEGDYEIETEVVLGSDRLISSTTVRVVPAR